MRCVYPDCSAMTFGSNGDLERHYREEHNETKLAESVHPSSRSTWSKESGTTVPTTVSGPSISKSLSGKAMQRQHALRDNEEGYEDESIAPSANAASTTTYMANARDDGSVISDASTLYTQEQKHDIVRRFSTLLSQSLHTTSVSLDREGQTTRLLGRLQDALKSFSVAVNFGTTDVLERQSLRAARGVRHFRRDIARRFYDQCLSRAQDSEPRSTLSGFGNSQGESVADKFFRWETIEESSTLEAWKPPAKLEDPVAGQVKLDDSDDSSWSSLGTAAYSSDLLDEPNASTDVLPGVYGAFVDPERIVASLTTQPAFRGLLNATERLLNLYNSSKPTLIRRQVSLAIRRHAQPKRRTNEHHRVLFNINWDPVRLLTEDYEQGVNQVLNRVVSITGTIGDAQLCSVGDYMKQTWPQNPSSILQALTRKLRGYSAANLSSLSKKGHINFSDDLRVVEVEGDENFVVLVAQQLAWLAAVLTIKQEHLCCAYIDFEQREEVDSPPASTPIFDIDVTMERPSGTPTDSCWNALVGPAIVVYGFPIAARNNNEKGLEISVAAMAALAGIPQGVTDDGVIVLKSRSWALVPVEERGDSVQWHFFMQPQKLEWTYLERLCSHRLRSPQSDIAQIMMSRRSFLALSPRFRNNLGK